jgi:uncharacterized membrane protein
MTLLNRDTKLSLSFSPAFFFFRLAIFFIPASYAIKFFIGLPDIIWLDPCLFIGVIAALFYIVEAKKIPSSKIIGVGLLLVTVYFLSSFANTVSAPIWFPKEAFKVQLMLAEPVKLFLNIIFFVLTFIYAQDAERRVRMAYWLGWSAVFQCVIALYLVATTYLPLPLPSSVADYMQDYALRQVLWFGDLRITRLGGTFIESPPFGLYMFSVFLITLYEAFQQQSKLFYFFALTALLGALGSLSTQVVGGIAIWGAVAILGLLNLKPKSLTRWLRNGSIILGAFLALVPILFYFAYAVSLRVSMVERYLNNPERLYASSFGERFFHFFNVLDVVTLNPLNLFLGVGSRYGFYVHHRFDIYPVTTTPQIAPIDVLSASGLIGLALFILWLFLMLKPLLFLPRLQGLAVWAGLLAAVSTQATWKWTAFFFALAYFTGKGLSFSARFRVKQ